MIVNLLLIKKGYGKGYLPKSPTSVLQPMFPTANLAIRREVIEKAGLFDTDCKTGEDFDLCIRVAQTQWDLFFEERAIVSHKHRTTLLALMKQWYGYGLVRPFIFKKHNSPCLEICYADEKGILGWSARRFYKVLGMNLPCYIVIFMTPFHIFNAALVFILLLALLKQFFMAKILFDCWILVGLGFLAKDMYQSMIVRKNPRWLGYFFIRQILNWVYTFSAWWHGVRIGVWYFEVTREQTP